MIKMETEFKSSLLPLNRIQACFFQTRTETMDEGFEDLVESIKEFGVVEPIIVRTVKDHFELVAGDRRLRAARQAGLRVIPVVIRDLSDEDALVLQATENLQRQGLSDPEKTRIVTELARRCKLDATGLAEKLRMSYSWVVKYLPADFKNGEKAEAGKLGGLAKGVSYQDKSAILDIAECEFCSVSTSAPKEWENHKLCPYHYGQALTDPARFKRFFGFQQQSPVLGQPAKPQSLETWEESDIHANPEQSEIIETISKLLLEKGIKPIITNRKYSVTTIIHMMFPNKNLVVYLNGKNAQNGKQLESDNELQEWLRKRHGMRVLSIMYGGKSKGETERIVNEIVREVKKNDA